MNANGVFYNFFLMSGIFASISAFFIFTTTWLPASSILIYLSPSINPGKGDLDRLLEDLLEDLVEARLLLLFPPPPRRVILPEGENERAVCKYNSWNGVWSLFGSMDESNLL